MSTPIRVVARRYFAEFRCAPALPIGRTNAGGTEGRRSATSSRQPTSTSSAIAQHFWRRLDAEELGGLQIMRSSNWSTAQPANRPASIENKIGSGGVKGSNSYTGRLPGHSSACLERQASLEDIRRVNCTDLQSTPSNTGLSNPTPRRWTQIDRSRQLCRQPIPPRQTNESRRALLSLAA